MIPGAKGHIFMLAWKNMTLGPAKHEKVARLGRISNVLGLREHKVRSNPLVSLGKENNIFHSYIIGLWENIE